MSDEKKIEPEGYLFGKIPYYPKKTMTWVDVVVIVVIVSAVVLGREY